MAGQSDQKKPSRRRFSAEFNTEALGLAEQVGVSVAARQLGLHESQIYAWRKKVRFEQSRSETEIGPGDTAPTATSAQCPLKLKWQLNHVSVVRGYDQWAVMLKKGTNGDVGGHFNCTLPRGIGYDAFYYCQIGGSMRTIGYVRSIRYAAVGV